MMKRNNTLLCASAAIAAALALPFTPLAAQAPAPAAATPDPVLVIPQTTAPPSAQPAPTQTVVLPTELPETAPQAATVRAADPAAPAGETARTERAAATPAARPATRVRTAAATPADPAPAPVAEEAEPLASDLAADTTAEPIAPVAVSEPVASSSTPAGNDNALQFGIAVIAAIAALVLAIWGFIAIGRRRSVDRKAAMIIERPVVRPREPVDVAPVAVAPSVSPLRAAAPAPSMAHSGAAVPLPSKLPATFEERDALLKRMIAARPDRANPFTSPVQRRKRARLILQSLGREFGDQEPRIDLSQYSANWPELARRNNAAA
jgi:hypothetical protein